ncbi:hypothetical protein CEXT_161601 [Caerostris extrusa]|uniref:Uncharacterized protein n=1 Tax=Caerostris extrusa TaxID=172846 RepID=A0AAV4MPA7_CAEEX|nr:hypothetical protein CEXT_161601 [Caerostris extrusa]
MLSQSKRGMGGVERCTANVVHFEIDVGAMLHEMRAGSEPILFLRSFQTSVLSSHQYSTLEDSGKERFISLVRRDKMGCTGGEGLEAAIWFQNSLEIGGEELVTRESIQVSIAFCGNGGISRNSNPAQILSSSDKGVI